MTDETYLLQEKIIEEIKAWNRIIIHRHVRPDPDALGSQIGLKEIITTSFPEKEVKIAGEDVKNLEFIGLMDSINSLDYEDALVIVLDTANTTRIDGEYIEKAKKLIKIDHHPNDDPYGDYRWVDPTFSSASEMISSMYLDHKDKLKLSANGARVLYGGIVGDTGRFMFSNTTSNTHKIVSQLQKFDFDHTQYLTDLYSITLNQAKLQGLVLEKLKVYPEGIASVIISQDELKRLDLGDSDTSGIVGMPGNIAGTIAWGVFIEQVDGSYRCRLRSKGPIINEVAKEHGGGGHPLASGARAYNLEEIDVIIEKFKKLALVFHQSH